MIILQYLATVIASGIINRFRGGGFWADKIPIKGLWMAAPLIGGLVFWFHGLYLALAFIAAYILWAIAPWGFWFDLGRLQFEPDRAQGKYELFIEDISLKIMKMFGLKTFRAQDTICMILRHLNIVPAMLIVSLVASNFLYLIVSIPLAFVIVACYEFSWILWENGKVDNPIEIAEILVGVLWGLLIVAI